MYLLKVIKQTQKAYRQEFLLLMNHILMFF